MRSFILLIDLSLLAALLLGYIDTDPLGAFAGKGSPAPVHHGFGAAVTTGEKRQMHEPPGQNCRFPSLIVFSSIEPILAPGVNANINRDELFVL